MILPITEPLSRVVIPIAEINPINSSISTPNVFAVEADFSIASEMFFVLIAKLLSHILLLSP